MTITTKATAKVAAVATGLAMATSMLALAPVAHAQLTSSQVDSIITLLQSFGADATTIANVRASLTGGTPTGGSTGGSASCSVGTTDLTIGSSGAGVTCLQQALIANGYSIPAGATGYFGAQTQAAVMAWQKAAGVMPAAGYFGPISRAAWNLGGSPTTPTTPGTPSTPTGLEGSDGMITDVDVSGTLNDEEVGEGMSNVEVLGADVEVSNDGDIALRSVRVSFDPTGNTGSDDLDDYLDGVSVWLDGDEIGSADVDDFTQDSNDLWVRTISVNNAVIRADDTARLVIAVDAANTIDSDDLSGDSWTIDIENIRFVDGSGVTTTDDSTGDINAMNIPMSFVNFAEAADTEVKLTTDSDSPDAGIVIVDEDDTTDDVSLLKGKLELEGDSDAVLDEFPVTFTVTGTATGLASTTGSVTLVIDGEEYTESIAASFNTAVSSVTFDNLDLDISAGDTIEFEVLADIVALDGSPLASGDTLKADVTASNRASMDIEDEEGDQIADSDRSGTATGEAQEFRVNGINLDLVSQSAVSNNNDTADTGTFKIRYKVTAVGDSVYVSSLATATGLTYAIDRAGTATTADNISGVVVNLTDTDKTSVGNYLIEEGESETLELTVVVPNGAGGSTGLHRMTLTGVKWDTDDDATPDNNYTSNLDDFQTDYVNLDNA